MSAKGIGILTTSRAGGARSTWVSACPRCYSTDLTCDLGGCLAAAEMLAAGSLSFLKSHSFTTSSAAPADEAAPLILLSSLPLGPYPLWIPKTGLLQPSQPEQLQCTPPAWAQDSFLPKALVLFHGFESWLWNWIPPPPRDPFKCGFAEQQLQHQGPAKAHLAKW